MTDLGGSAGDGFTVPLVLRSARFVPRQGPGRRQPARVTTGAFRAAGLPVPDNPAQRNAYQLSRRRGWPWSPAIDRHAARRGAELLGCGEFIQIDIDVPAGPDGQPAADPLRWLFDRATEAGEFLDITAPLAVRTPGHPDRGHLPGWHLWYTADPRQPVRMGAMTRCRHIELRGRGTCPGSPGYAVTSAPVCLPLLPPWIAALAGPPPAPSSVRASAGGPSPENRLHGILDALLAAERGERNSLLYWASKCVGEIVAAGALEPAAAQKILMDAAAEIGLLAEDGQRPVAATISSGLRQAGAA